MTTATIELPIEVYRLAEQTAQAQHIGLADLVAQAIEEKSRPDAETRARILAAATELSHLEDENARITELIDREFNSSRARAEAAA